MTNDAKLDCGAIRERDATNRETLRERYSKVGKPASGVGLLHSCCYTWVTPYMLEHSCSSKKHSYVAHSKPQRSAWNPNERTKYYLTIKKFQEIALNLCSRTVPQNMRTALQNMGTTPILASVNLNLRGSRPGDPRSLLFVYLCFSFITPRTVYCYIFYTSPFQCFMPATVYCFSFVIMPVSYSIVPGIASSLFQVCFSRILLLPVFFFV